MYIQFFLWQIKHTARQTLLEITVTVSEYTGNLRQDAARKIRG